MNFDMFKNVYTCVVQTPIGSLKLTEGDGMLAQIEFASTQVDNAIDRRIRVSPRAGSPFLQTVCLALLQYLEHGVPVPSLNLARPATPFAARVRQALLAVPFGQTVSYASLALSVGSAPRAVANACAKNPLPLVVPCHRVIGSDGSLRGFLGGLACKRALIELEANQANRQRTSEKTRDVLQIV